MESNYYAIHYKDNKFLTVDYDRDYGNIMSIEDFDFFILNNIIYVHRVDAENDLDDLKNNRGSIIRYDIPKEVIDELSIEEIKLNIKYELY